MIGAQQTYDYFRQIQDRITGFVCSHCSVSKQRMEEMMIRQGMLSRDLGTILVGEQAVYEGIISSVGGIREAVQKLHELADGYRAGRMKKKNSNPVGALKRTGAYMRSSMGIIGVSSSTVAKRKTVLSRAMDTVVIVVSMNGKCTAALTA
mgnify:CR=1 FL=1